MPKAQILKRLIPHLATSIADFESEIGAGNGTIGKAWKNDSDLGDGLVRKILKKFPTVNEKWLETGEGEMFIMNGIAHQEPQPDTTALHTDGHELDYRTKYEQLLEKINAEQSAIIAGVLNRIDANLNDAANRQQIFRTMTNANQQVMLETLAELRGVNKNELVHRARSIGDALLHDNEEIYNSDSSDNSGK